MQVICPFSGIKQGTTLQHSTRTILSPHPIFQIPAFPLLSKLSEFSELEQQLVVLSYGRQSNLFTFAHGSLIPALSFARQKTNLIDRISRVAALAEPLRFHATAENPNERILSSWLPAAEDLLAISHRKATTNRKQAQANDANGVRLLGESWNMQKCNFLAEMLGYKPGEKSYIFGFLLLPESTMVQKVITKKLRVADLLELVALLEEADWEHPLRLRALAYLRRRLAILQSVGELFGKNDEAVIEIPSIAASATLLLPPQNAAPRPSILDALNLRLRK